jgi:DNA-binding response OmpR family regulator
VPVADVILVVDDEDMVLGTVCRMLSRAGFEVLAAASSEGALSVGAGHPQPIDLMVADVVMPGLNGLAMADRFRLGHPETQLIFMAGLPDSPEIAAILARGLAFLPKPFLPAVLVEKVREVLDASRNCAARAQARGHV